MDYLINYFNCLRIEALQNIHYSHSYWIFLLPAVAILGDIISGWSQAAINGTLDSTKMRTGLIRKALEVFILAFFWCVSLAMGKEAVIICASGYVVLTETISILENLDQAGVPMPTWLLKRLKKTADSIMEDEDDTENN